MRSELGYYQCYGTTRVGVKRGEGGGSLLLPRNRLAAVLLLLLLSGCCQAAMREGYDQDYDTAMLRDSRC